MQVSFSSSTDKTLIRKLLRYVRKKVSFASVARKYRFKYSDNHNFLCWLHPENNPSARVKKKNGRETYVCYTGCGYGDVLWVVGKLEDLDNMPEIIEFMDDHFDLDLENNLHSVLGVKEVVTLGDKVWKLKKRVFKTVVESVADYFHGVPRGTFKPYSPGVNVITRLKYMSEVDNFWDEMEEADSRLFCVTTLKEAEDIIFEVRDGALHLLEKLERESLKDKGLTIESVFGVPPCPVENHPAC